MTCAPTAPGVSGERRVERLRRDAVRDPQLGVELGLHEARAQAGDDQAVDRARVGGALDDDLVAEMHEREARDVVALRRAVQEEPGPPRAPRLGREQLRLLPRRRLGPDVDALDQSGDVECERGVADRLAELRVGPGPALVARHMEAAGPAARVGAQRVEVGRLGLDQPSVCRTAATASARGLEAVDALELPAPEPRHRLAGLAGERDLRQRAPLPADGDQRVRRADHERVAGLPHPGRHGDADPRVRLAAGRRPAGSRASCRRPRVRPSTPPPSRRCGRRSRRPRPPRRAAGRPPPRPRALRPSRRRRRRPRCTGCVRQANRAAGILTVSVSAPVPTRAARGARR